MVELCHYFSNIRSVEVHLILLTKDTIFFRLPEHVVIHEPSFYISNKLVYTLKTCIYLRRLLKKVKPYSLLSFGEMYNNFVLLSTLFLPVKVYVSDRSKPDKDWGVLHNSLRRLLYPKAHGIISQTDYSRTFLQKETRHSRIRVIPNPVSIGKDILLDERGKVILNVGRLIKSKRIDILLDIFLASFQEGWKLWIVGDGPEKEYLQEIAARKGIGDNVVFWGNQKDIHQFYQKASIFAFTSESEGFPNALLEAISFGLPCLSFNCVAGPSDLIDHKKNGYLVNLYDVDAYIQYIKLLLNDESLRVDFGKHSLTKAKKFDIEIVGELFYKTLDE